MSKESIEFAPRIAKILIRGLFGVYDYSITGHENQNLGDTVILYGENGSGKTTILQIIFDMLSPANDRGHRSTLFRIPFRYVEIQMSDGVELIAQRSGEELVGPYDLEVWIPGKGPLQLSYNRKFIPEEAEESYISALESLNLLIYFISDERQILSDSIARPSEDDDLALIEWPSRPEKQIIARANRPSALQQTLLMVNQWISRQAALGANAGDDNVNSIYTDIIRQLAERRESPESPSERSTIKTILLDLSKRCESYAKYGFVSSLRAEPLVEFVDKAPNEALPAIARALEPYITGTKAWLDALENIQRITSVFVTSFSDFYSNKHVDFNVVEGLRICAANGEQLMPEQLSSGERQLVRLFCYTLMSRDKPSIFIIDEPELSLNIKWQRKLIRALNALVEGTNTQFLFATHSMEILAQHRRSVVPLIPLPKDTDSISEDAIHEGPDAYPTQANN